MPLPRLDIWPGWTTARRPLYAGDGGFRQARLPASYGGAGRVGGVSVPEPGAGAQAVRAHVRAADRQILGLASAPASGGRANRVRRAGQLEADRPELLRVLPLPADPPGARQAD